MSRKKEPYLLEDFFIILAVVTLIIIFVASLGNLNIGKKGIIAKEFKDTKEQAKRRHNKLKAHIDKQEETKKRLLKLFVRIYFGIRFLIVVLWTSVIYAFYYFGLIKGLGDLINYSQAMLLVCLTFNFLTFGTIPNLNNFISLIRMRLENWIWGKHINIEEKIDNNKLELIHLENEIKPIVSSGI